METITCSECKKSYKEEDLKKESGLLTCPTCKKKFKSKPREETLPPGFSLEKRGEALIIKGRLFTTPHKSTPLGLAVASFLFSFGLVLGLLNSSIETIFIWSLLPIFLIGFLVSAYYSLAVFFGFVEIITNSNSLSVRTYPFPISKNQVIPSASIRQLYCTKDSAHHSRQFGRIVYTYALRAILDSDQVVKIFTFESPDYVWPVETLLENHLKIKDGEVAEEFQG